MATLAKQISSALMTKIPGAFAARFGLDEAEVKQFMQEYLQSQFGKPVKNSSVRHNGKGRQTGFILYSCEQRPTLLQESPGLAFAEQGRELGLRWKKLSDEERANWSLRAQQLNESNGFAQTPAKTKTPAAASAAGGSPAGAPTKAKAKAAAAGKASGAAGKKAAAGKAAAASATDASDGAVKVVKDASTNEFVVEGTTYVVRSSKDHVVTGRIRNKKVSPLTPADVQDCQKRGLTCSSPAPAAVAAAVPEKPEKPAKKQKTQQ